MTAPRGRTIVVGVDGSADSNHALDWATAMAATQAAHLHLVYALPQLTYEVPYWHAEEERHRDYAVHLLAGARARVEATGTKATVQTVDQAAAPALIDAGGGALMIVLGARGHGALSGLLLGSVSQHVSRHAPCPVVVVRQQADPQADRIVVGVDGSSASARAVEFGFDTAARLGAPLVAIHAWPDRAGRPTTGPALGDVEHIAERIDFGRRLVAEALAGWSEKYPDVAVVNEAIPVHPARVLTDASEHAALVVVGSRGRGEFAGLLLGSVSQAVLHHARSPVAVVR